MPEPNVQIKQLQGLELGMLRECLAILDRHSLRYFLLHGSALGAVRHSGFIPWDDDIDIGIPRPDYDKFISFASKELPSELFLQNYDTDPAFPMCYTKIRLSKTTFIQSNLSHLPINHGVFIDIFPLDGYPKGIINQWIIRNCIYLLDSTILLKLKLPLDLRISSIKLALVIPIKIILAKYFSLRTLRKIVHRLIRFNNYDNSHLIVNWHGSLGKREVIPKTMFAEGRSVSFEGIMVKIPEEYDAYLTLLYGDYMTIPPIEDQVSHHFTDKIDLDHPYTNYK